MGVKEVILGTRETISGTVYGTIVVLAAITAGGAAYANRLWELEVIVGSTVIILWIAHVYSDAIGDSLAVGRRLSAGEVVEVGRRELSIPIAAILPMGVIALGATGVVSAGTTLWLAVGVGVVILATEGIRYARLERLSRAATILSVALNLSLGLVIVALKASLGH